LIVRTTPTASIVYSALSGTKAGYFHPSSFVKSRAINRGRQSGGVDTCGLDAAVRYRAGVVRLGCTRMVREVCNGRILNHPDVGVGTLKGVGCAGGFTTLCSRARVAGAGGRCIGSVLELRITRAIISSASAVRVRAIGLDAAFRFRAGVVRPAGTQMVRDKVGNGLILNQPVVGDGTVKGVGCAGGKTTVCSRARVAGAGGRCKGSVVELRISRAIIFSASAVRVLA